MKRIFSAGLSVALACSLCLTPVSALTVQQAGALLEQFYVDQIPDSVLAQEDLDSMLEALGDPYTVYMTKEEYSAFLNSVNGETLVGIGVSIQKEVTENGFLILSILPDSRRSRPDWRRATASSPLTECPSPPRSSPLP